MNDTTPAPATNGEPLAPVSVIIAIVSALITLLVSFGVDLTREQIGALVAFVTVVAPVLVWLIGRRKTTATKNIVAVVDKAGDVVAGEAAPLPNGLPVSVRANPGGDL